MRLSDSIRSEQAGFESWDRLRLLKVQNSCQIILLSLPAFSNYVYGAHSSFVFPVIIYHFKNLSVVIFKNHSPRIKNKENPKKGREGLAWRSGKRFTK